ncbi:asparagine synthase-related protein [Bacillus sp. AFS017336]|uniref:asparagine synthase-related protein n=1 Tax=Bacillus sp. AFS017336 TaxID=2033489 RepID=UPI000BEFFFBD|nr:asparagine synthase-related protein [Bacillus sp. AFS017336]PEL07016.1 asparagine synthetase B [Bacillus sp. AFS017336]
MSAITGIIHFNNEPLSIEHGLGLMKNLQKYPADDIQVWHKENVFLGCHAQWITPESIGEQLPFYDYERKLVITADAIIDNREELFDSLQVNMTLRKSMADSQLILLAYEKWGEDSPKYLVGDFAYIIWDEKKRILFGARDFSGNRTLYYYKNHKLFTFCTVIRPMFSLPYIEKQINEQWLAEYLSIPVNYESTDLFSTVYKNIEQLPPSHTITITNGEASLARYSTLMKNEKLKLKSNAEYEEAFREVYKKAIKARLRTHQKVGAHLSGGLDSGSVVGFAARDLLKENKKLHTFSYVPVQGFVDWTHKSRIADERPYIQSTVNYVGNIDTNFLDFAERSPLTEIDEWLDMLEMPYKFFENTYWLNGIYEEAQKQGIGVLLNGQRGNWTVSWGPALDYQAMLLKKLKLIRFYSELKQYSRNLGVNTSKVFKVVKKIAFPSLNSSESNSEHFPVIINSDFARRMNVYEKLSSKDVDLTGTNFADVYEIRKRHFEDLYYWNITGTYGTKLSLRYSLWDRDPTNDLNVIRFCLSVPEGQFVQNGLGRALIRRATKNILPDNVRLNQQVRGVQGSDGVHRMAPFWNEFIAELKQLSEDPLMCELLNMDTIRAAILKIQNEAQPEFAFDFDFRILMRSLIVYRFMKKAI